MSGSVSVVPLDDVCSVESSDVDSDPDSESAALEEDWRLKKLKMRGRRRVAPGSKPMSRSSMASSALEALDRSEMSEPRR